MRWLVATAFS